MYGKLVKPDINIRETYSILTRLGKGGNGTVYLAWQKRLCKFVVIKIAPKCSSGELEVCRNEVEAIKNIKSMYIPQVLDFILDDNYSYTIIEYVEGESFDRLLTAGARFSHSQIIGWYIQLARALETIHKQDICHRDIKPSNIMINKNGNICLIDFNSAYVSSNKTGVVSRSIGYASPEQYEYFKLCKKSFNESNDVNIVTNETDLLVADCVTEAAPGTGAISGEKSYIDWKLSDIYSLGATIYHLLIGKRPPVKPEEVVLITMEQGYSKALLTIISKSMMKNPNDRYTSAEQLREAVQSLKA